MITKAAASPVLDLALADALAWEAGRLADIAAGRCASSALLWSCEPALVAPSNLGRLPGFARASAQATSDGWPVHLRSTGGDLVPQGPGIVNLSLMWSAPQETAPSIEEAFRRLTAPICGALSSIGLTSSLAPVPDAFCDGRFNVAVAGRKFAGTAQRWRPTGGGYAIHAHAMMLMRTPDDAAIRALNRFYRDCGINRTIRASAHIGLQDVVQRNGTSVSQHHFLSALADRVQA
ncbi:hypothetical protein [Vannielia sp.]|uniref:lipoate--protein ligase family protein n=1 Tax=Vannielia sp. TaxID=2813045 RepID=UPI00261579EC|nr:hypothetical protein [Vannielia sp.]MDF1872830.1 hypothetical protein [Vannielia sp.]